MAHIMLSFGLQKGTTMSSKRSVLGLVRNHAQADAVVRPHLIMAETEAEQLSTLALQMEQAAPLAADLLLREIDRAEVRPDADMPDHVVRMRSTVRDRVVVASRWNSGSPKFWVALRASSERADTAFLRSCMTAAVNRSSVSSRRGSGEASVPRTAASAIAACSVTVARNC